MPHELWEDIVDAIDRKHWAAVGLLADKISSLLESNGKPKGKRAKQAQAPSVDARGFYGVGWQSYMSSPDDIKTKLNHMNELIKDARSKLDGGSTGVTTSCMLPWKDPGR